MLQLKGILTGKISFQISYRAIEGNCPGDMLYNCREYSGGGIIFFRVRSSG